MNYDKLKFWLILLLFPLVYLGIAILYVYYDIYVIGRYEPKSGRWGSFPISLAAYGFTTCQASLGYWIGLAWLKTEPQQLPRPRLALITVLSAALSLAVFLAIMIIEPGMPVLLWFGSVCLIPALFGVSLIKIHQSRFTNHQSTQR
jgi:hypothetical protein